MKNFERQKQRRKRLRLHSKQKREQATIYYYPIYRGWKTSQSCPVFTNPTEATIYQISNFIKDSLHLFKPNLLPTFLSIVGTINDPPVSNIEHIKSGVYYFLNNHHHRRQSKIMTEFFAPMQLSTINNYHLPADTTKLLQIDSNTFKQCCLQFNEPDYFLSSYSIFKIPPTYHKLPPPKLSLVDQNLNKSIPQTKDLHNYVSIGYGVQNQILKSSPLWPDHQINIVVRKLHTTLKKQKDPPSSIIISIGSGTAATELSTSKSNHIILCLEKDPRSVYAARMKQKFLATKNVNLFSELFLLHPKQSTSLQALIKQINSTLKLQISILFQHPTPDTNFQQHLMATKSLFIDLMCKDHIVDTVVFVFDKRTNGCDKCYWSNMIQSLFASTNLNISSSCLISQGGKNEVEHPLFGHIKRDGWAHFKHYSDEYTIKITRN